MDAEARAHVASEGGDSLQRHPRPEPVEGPVWQEPGEDLPLAGGENDVNVVASHQKERERRGSQSPPMANKVEPSAGFTRVSQRSVVSFNVSAILQDAFTCFSSAYPDFVEALRLHRAFEEVQVQVQVQSLQEGQALVGFETLQSLNESEEPKRKRYAVTTRSLEFSGAAKHYTMNDD